MADRKPVRILADRHGGASAEVKAQLKRERAFRKALRVALAEGAKTVAEIAEATEMDERQALWFLMAFKKYGEVVEGEQQGDAYAYKLKT
jgi:hypothetical protein